MSGELKAQKHRQTFYVRQKKKTCSENLSRRVLQKMQTGKDRSFYASVKCRREVLFEPYQ